MDANGPVGSRTAFQDLSELMRRLHEMGDTSPLILQFGPLKADTLAPVAARNFEYVRQFVYRAKRAEIRAAACRLVSAIVAADEHKQRAARRATRRSSGYRAGPRGYRTGPRG